MNSFLFHKLGRYFPFCVSFKTRYICRGFKIMPSEPSADKVFRARSDGSGSLSGQHSQHSTPKQTRSAQPAAFPSGLSQQMKPSFSTKKSKMNSNAIGNNSTSSYFFTLSCSRLLLVGLFLLTVSVLQIFMLSYGTDHSQSQLELSKAFSFIQGLRGHSHIETQPAETQLAETQPAETVSVVSAETVKRPSVPNVPSIPVFPGILTYPQPVLADLTPPVPALNNDEWTSVVDKKTGKVYWWNKITGKTTRVGVANPGLSISSPSLPQKPSPSKKFTRGLIFTIDSIDSYVKNRMSGPSGEILVRESLQRSFDLLNVKYDLVRSDQEANLVKPEAYDFFVLDPWTWAGKVLAPKSFLLGNERKVFILDYLGAGGSQLNSRRSDSSLASRVPADRFLTAYGLDPAHAFLGFSMAPAVAAFSIKKHQGVIWGKSSSFLIKHTDLLSQIADVVELHSTCSVEVLKHPNIHWHGSLSDTDWMVLLRESKFLLGLGDPVLGPSAIDAVASGVVYINPVYAEPR